MLKVKATVIGLMMLVLIPALAQAQKSSKVPSITALSPTSATAGGAGFMLTVTGSNFTSGTTLQWNGAALTTTYVSATQLQGLVANTMIASAGTASITAYTSGRWGGSSNTLSFTINAPALTTTTTTTTTTTSSTPLSITTSSVPSGTAGSTYSTSFNGTGGTPQYLWSLPSGSALPPGLILASTGSMTGTPSSAGTYSFTVQATDSSSSQQTAQKVFSMSVASAPTTTTTTTTTTTSGTPLLQDDFEGGSLSKWTYLASPSNFGTIQSTTTVVPGIGLNGSNGVQLRLYTCGDSTNTACGGSAQDNGQYIQKGTKAAPWPDANGLSDEYISGHVMFHLDSGGTGNPAGRKLFYLMDPGLSGQAYDWAVIMSTQINANTFTVSFDGGPSNPCKMQGATAFSSIGSWTWDTWYWIQLYVHANTPGSSDGAISVWIDGNQVLNQTGLNLRGTCSTGIVRHAIGFQVNRYNYNLADEYRYWDNVAISNSFINF